MKVAVDLHIHSCLSPCSDNDMTPNNIINMAILKGLDIIAITDHNTAENLSACMECGLQNGIIVVPGMEIETSEEVHVVCFFPSLEVCLKMQEIIYNSLPAMRNKPYIFGEQIIMNKEDEITGYVDRFLLTASNLSINEVYEIVKSMGGVMIPAHIDRDSYSILANLGLIPEDLEFKYLEISRKCDINNLLKEHEELNKYKLIKSSDAHYLMDIFEKENFMEIEEKTIKGLLQELKFS